MGLLVSSAFKEKCLKDKIKNNSYRDSTVWAELQDKKSKERWEEKQTLDQMWEKEHFLCRSFSPWQFNLTNMCVWHMRGRRQRRGEGEREREGLHSSPLMSVFYRAFDHCLQSVCACVWGDRKRSPYAIQNNLGTHLKKFENWHWSIINLINDFTPINLIPVPSLNMISQPRVLIFIVCGNTFQSSDRRNFNFTSYSQLRSFLINYLYSHNSLIISPIFRSISALMRLVWSQLIFSSHFLPFVSPPSASLHLSAFSSLCLFSPAQMSHFIQSLIFFIVFLWHLYLHLLLFHS